MNLEADFRAMNRRTVLASILSALFLGATLNADNEIGFVEKFALLILSEEFGAVVREANPPKQ